MRGKVLGGSSSINVMAYTRGNRGDYDRWAQKGARGWSYADVLPYFQRCETFEKGANAWRGGSGPLGTEFAKTRQKTMGSMLTENRSSIAATSHERRRDAADSRPIARGAHSESSEAA